MAKAVGKRCPMVKVLGALVEQSRQLAETRRHKYCVEAGLDRSSWDDYKTLPPELARALTRYAADKVAGQYKLAGAAAATSGSCDAPRAASSTYHWQQVEPTEIAGVEAGDAAQAWVLRRVAALRPRVRVVLLTAGGFARCTCPHHEQWGLPCRHVLFLFGPPSLEMCDRLWWHSTILGKLDDWLWGTYYRGLARTPGVLVGTTPASPAGAPCSTGLGTPSLTVTTRYIKAAWAPNATPVGAPIGSECTTSPADDGACSALGPTQSSSKSYPTFQSVVALARQAWEAAWALGKEEELIQAGTEFITTMQLMVPRVDFEPGELSDGRPVGYGGAARLVRGTNDSSVEAPGCDQSRGSNNKKRRKTGPQQGGAAIVSPLPSTGPSVGHALASAGFIASVRSQRGAVVNRGANVDATRGYPPAGGLGN
jgi:hypothetical protein